MSHETPKPPDGPTSANPDPPDLLSVDGVERPSDVEPSAPHRAAVVSLVGPVPTELAESESESESGSEPDELVEPVDDEAMAEHYDVDSLPRGTQLGRFMLLGRIGETNHGVIYGAYDPVADRKVTLKLFQPSGEGESKDDQMARVAQIQALAKLSHPCVEQIYEAGAYGPWVFRATEFFDGIDLRQWMEVRDEPFPWPEVLRLFREAGRGLAAAHKVGIVHRDFRPSNVLLGKEGRLVVVDFGLAPNVAEEDDDIDISELRESLSGVTSEDRALLTTGRSGTPAYMAPEQHLTGFADARSDQFSFCVALYEALYGERPFSGNRPRAIALAVAKHQVRPAPAGSSVPGWLRTVVVRGLHPDPAERYPSIEGLLRELARDPAASRRRWVWGAVVVGGLAAGATGLAVQLEADVSACDSDTGALTLTWNATRRESLRQAFVGTERAWAEPTWAYAENHLDAWSTEWRNLSERACLATRVWGDAAGIAYRHRVRCLDGQLAGFDATLGVLAEVDGSMLDHAHLLAATLPSPRHCLDSDTLIALGLPAEQQREMIEGLNDELSELEARMVLGQRATVVLEATSLLPRLEATEDATTIARGQLLMGRAQRAAGEPSAEQTLHTAAQTALRAGHGPFAVDAWLQRMDVLRDLGRWDEAAALGDYVAAILENKRFSWLRPRLEIARGDVERARDRPADALGHYHAAIEHEEIRNAPDPLQLLPAWLGLAEIHLDRDDAERALAPLHTALDVIRDVLGPKHPAAIDLLRLSGRAQRQRGQLDDARGFLEQALALVELRDGPATSTRAELDADIGALAAAQGDVIAAQTHLSRAYRTRGGAEAAVDPEVFRLGVSLSNAHTNADDRVEARRILEALLARAVESGGEPTDGAGMITAIDLVDAKLRLAELIWNGGEVAQARTQVEDLVQSLADDTLNTAPRDQAQAWLEEHPLP